MRRDEKTDELARHLAERSAKHKAKLNAELARLKDKCAGCEKDLSKPQADSREVKLGPNVFVQVCAGGRGHSGRKESCALKARQKIPVCPGCGTPQWEYAWLPGDICDHCSGLLKSEREREDKKAEERHVYVLDVYRFLHGFGLPTEAVTKILLDLAKACSGKGEWFDRTTGQPIPARPADDPFGRAVDGPGVRLTAEQHEALERFCRSLRRLLEAARLKGRHEGNSILLNLARGNMGAEAYDEQSKKLLGDLERLSEDEDS